MRLLRTPNLNSASTSHDSLVLCLSLHHGDSPEGIKILQILIKPWLSLLLYTVIWMELWRVCGRICFGPFINYWSCM